MKKHLLLLTLASGLALGASAQQRFVLYEEFTGENCPPCAATNPGLEALMDAGTNPEHIIMIKYQSPIPSAGPIYTANPTFADNRLDYYDVTSAPNGKMDGANSPGGDGGGHPGYLTQALIDARTAVTSPFNITISGVSITTSGVSATVTVSAVTTGSYGNLKLRAALVETLDYATAPGTNGEKHFPHVVRQMYPDANGQDAGNSWTGGATSTFTISGIFPSFSDINNEHFLVVWLQDDDGKVVHQAARTYPDLEIKSNGMNLSSGLLCGTPNTFTPEVTIKNEGLTTITSATIFYKESTASTWSSYAWSGSLASHASTTVTLPGITSSSTGFVSIIDSVANPNGVADKFLNNNKSEAGTYVLQNTGGTFPIASTFETETPAFVEYYGSGGYPIFRWNGAGKGYDGSNYMLAFPCYSIASGTKGFSIFPFANVPSGAKALDFYVAYCQYSSENDKLEVVYSTDCGASWTSVWNKSGADLASKEAQETSFIPSGNSQWRLFSVDVSAIPNGAQIAFRATSNYGNNMFIDNVNLRSGTVTGIENTAIAKDLEVYPNPVTNKLNVKLTAANAFDANIVITNVSGQTVLQLTQAVVAGSNTIEIDAANLAPGSYMIAVGSQENGTIFKKFVKQ